MSQKLLDLVQVLRQETFVEMPEGMALVGAITALDVYAANVRLVEIEDIKAAADALAGVDVDTLHPIERDAVKALVRAKASAAVERAKEAAAKAEEDAAKAAEATKAEAVAAERAAVRG